MMHLTEQIKKYIPCNEQEERDQAQMLHFMGHTPDCLTRKNTIAHFSASIWTLNPSYTKTLMIYHNIYDSWSWIGGHADGDPDLCAVALRELQEETGVENAVLVSPDIFSLETLTVNGHMKKGIYVPSHLHLNVTYLAVAEESAPLRIKPDENQKVSWFTFSDALTLPTESWMIERIYAKLIQKCVRLKNAPHGF